MSTSKPAPTVRKRNLLIAGAAAIVIFIAATIVSISGASGFFTATESENGTLAGNAQLVTDSTASGGKAVRFNAPAAPPSNPTPPTSGSYVQPGSVGYLGSPSALTVISSQATIPSSLTGSCKWDSSDGLRCDSASVTMDHVYVKGGIYWTGNGKLTITNSIIEGSLNGFVIVTHGTGHPTVAVSDSTLRWQPGKPYPAGYDAGVVNDGEGSGIVMQLYRDDISGMPQGVDPDYDNSIIDSCWIHDLIHTGDPSKGTDTHVDGIFPQGGNNLTISHNYIDVEDQGVWATAAVFFQVNGGTTTGYKVIGNYMIGGGYTFRNQTALNVDMENNTIGSGVWGYQLIEAPGTTGTWSNNVQPNGTAIGKPSR